MCTFDQSFFCEQLLLLPTDPLDSRNILLEGTPFPSYSSSPEYINFHFGATYENIDLVLYIL